MHTKYQRCQQQQHTGRPMNSQLRASHSKAMPDRASAPSVQPTRFTDRFTIEVPITSLSDYHSVPRSPSSSTNRTVYILGSGTTHHDDFALPVYGHANDILIVCHPLTTRDTASMTAPEIRAMLRGLQQCGEASRAGTGPTTTETRARSASARVLKEAYTNAL